MNLAHGSHYVDWVYDLENEITQKLGLRGQTDKIMLVRGVLGDYFSKNFLEVGAQCTLTEWELFEANPAQLKEIKDMKEKKTFLLLADEMHRSLDKLAIETYWMREDFQERFFIKAHVHLSYPAWKRTEVVTAPPIRIKDIRNDTD